MVGHDSVTFQAMADEMATHIQTRGWSEWSFGPNLQRIVGIIAAIYAITGVHEPFIVTPLYALFYAVSAVCIYRTASLLSGSEAGGWYAAAAFLLFPSAATIYADMHKDAVSSAGLLLLVSTLAELETRERVGLREGSSYLAISVVAVLLLWLVRPYLIKLCLGMLFFGLIAVLAANAVLMARRRFDPRRYLPYLALFVLMAGITSYSSAPLMDASPNPIPIQIPLGTQSADHSSNTEGPSLLDRLFNRTVAPVLYVRSGFALTPGGSVVDKDVRITSFSDLATYLPRTMQIAIFAPFPNMWFERGMTAGARMMRLVSGLEMAICYILFVGYIFLVPSLRRNRIAAFVFVMTASLTLLCVLGLAVPNIGTLYRMRYPIFMLVAGLGASGWAVLFAKLRARAKLEPSSRIS
jgi:hypothetical protein